MRDAELHTALLQSTAELAGLAVDISLQRLIRCLRKAYLPEQPRDETGRWTPFGGFGQADRQPRAESVQVAQGGRGVPRLPGSARITINGREFEVSIPQQIRIERAVDRYNAAYEQIIERDPNWKPRPSLSSPNSVEDEVRVRDSEANEAEARLRDQTQERIIRQLQGRVSNGTLNDMLLPNGQEIGMRLPGVGPDIRTVTPPEYRALRNWIESNPELPTNSRLIRSNYGGKAYQLGDGSIIGIREGRNGSTIDVLTSANPTIKPGYKCTNDDTRILA